MKLNTEELKKCKEMAVLDFELFCRLAGVDIIQLKACIMRSKGLSLAQIAIKLDMPKSTIYSKSEKCTKKTNEIA